MNPLLSIEDLYVAFRTPRGGLALGYRVVWALRGVSLSVEEGESLGVVGGSGGGKSTLLRAVVGLVKPLRGSIIYRGLDLLKLSWSQRRRVLREVGYVPQEPSQSMDPKMSVRDIVLEPLLALGTPRKSREYLLESVLELVDLPGDVKGRNIRELSGGMQQRVAIARALVTKPRLLLLDEPTSSLDVSTAAQILNLLKDLRETLGLSYVMVSHDIDSVSYVADRVAVMALGMVVEVGPTRNVLAEPLHPYTRVLVEPEGVEGEVALDSETACPAYRWCPWRRDRCAIERPKLVEVGKRHLVMCWRYV
jgi:ABC-type glutathione transport system ATPase component